MIAFKNPSETKLHTFKKKKMVLIKQICTKVVSDPCPPFVSPFLLTCQFPPNRCVFLITSVTAWGLRDTQSQPTKHTLSNCCLTGQRDTLERKRYLYSSAYIDLITTHKWLWLIVEERVCHPAPPKKDGQFCSALFRLEQFHNTSAIRAQKPKLEVVCDVIYDKRKS